MSASSLYTQSLSWKSYQLLRKKAMEQELSWSGLVISLSIAFFLVVACALTLRFVAISIESNNHQIPHDQHERVLDVQNLV